jgi:hypothetical protein
VATLEDVYKISVKLPGSIPPETERFGFSILVKGKAKGYLWTWAERVDPKKSKVINETVIAVTVPSLEMKDLLIAADPTVYFTEDHYRGFPAILVRLESITLAELENVIIEGWKCKALPEHLAQYRDQSSA